MKEVLSYPLVAQVERLVMAIISAAVFVTRPTLRVNTHMCTPHRAYVFMDEAGMCTCTHTHSLHTRAHGSGRARTRTPTFTLVRPCVWVKKDDVALLTRENREETVLQGVSLMSFRYMRTEK